MPEQKMYVKFCGKLRDLKPDGWKFWKAFANNYRVYSKVTSGKQYGQTINVWQHLGGYVEIDDFHGESYLVVQAIQDGSIKNWETYDGHLFTAFLHLKEDRIFAAPSYEERPNTMLYATDPRPTEAEIRDYFDTWREVHVNVHTIREVERLLEKGWIEVIPDLREY